MSSPVSSRRSRGRQGEALAEQFLRRAGFRILARNVHLRHAELDLVALEGSTLCFVEVRLRSSDAFGSAEESVDIRKQRRVLRAARGFLARERPPRHSQIRFDVVAIDASRIPAAIRLIRDAFDAS
jgi:putative endonuclease